MNAFTNIFFKNKLKRENYLPILLGCILSSLMLGYALSSILVGALVVSSIFRLFFNPSSFKFNYRLTLPILLYVLFVVSMFWSVNKELTLKGIGRTVTLFVIPLSFMCLPSLNSKDITKIFKIFTVSNLIFCKFFLFYAIYRFISTSNLAVFSYHELVSILDLNAIYVSVYFALNLIYIIQKSKKSRFDIWVAIVFLGFIILLSSKTIIACLLILLIIYSFLRSGFKKLFKKNIIVFIISSLIFLLISQHVVSRFISEGNSNIEEVLAMKDTNHTYPWTGTTIRLLQLRFLHNQIQEDNIFITGFGLFASRENLSNRHKSFGTYPGYHSYNYHNMYAQILSETGVLGFSILFGILLLNIVLSIQRKSYLFLSFSIIMTVWFLTESVLWVQRGLFFFIIIHCIFNKLQNYNSDWKTEN